MLLNKISTLFLTVVFGAVCYGDWTQTARVVGYNPTKADVDISSAMEWAKSLNASVVVIRQTAVSEFDWLDKRNKGDSLALDLLDRVIKTCHRNGLRAVVDLSVLELRSSNGDADEDGKLDVGATTLLSTHSSWIQEDLQGNKAVFYGKINPESKKGDETVWANIHSSNFKTKLLALVKAVSSINPDGILFSNVSYPVREGWENKWASFDSYSVTNFNSTLPTQSQLGDVHSAAFTKWASWRMNKLSQFSTELNSAVKNENPDVKTFMLIKNAISHETLVRGYDFDKLTKIFDGFVYDIDFLGDAVSRNSYEWMMYFASIKGANELDGEKPSWVIDRTNTSSSLTVSKDMNKFGDAVATGMYTSLQAGMNVWITGGNRKYSAATNVTKMAEIFSWVKENQNWLYGERKVAQSVGVYFSQSSLLYRTGNKWQGHLASFYGTLMMLHELHIPTTIISTGNLSLVDKEEVEGIILPQVDCASTVEIDSLREYYEKSNLIVYFSGSDDNHCTEKGVSADFSWDDQLLEVMQRGGINKGETFFNNVMMDGNGNLLNENYPNSVAADIKTQFSTDLNFAAQIGYAPFEMPSTTAVRAVKTDEAFFYHLVNFGGLDNGNIARSIEEEVNIYRNGEELESGAIEMNGGSLEVISYYSDLNSEQTLNLVENSMGSSAIIRAGALPDLEEDVVSNKFMAANRKKPSFNLPKKLLVQTKLIKIHYQNPGQEIETMDFQVYDIHGRNIKQISLERGRNGFSANWDLESQPGNYFQPGMYAYRLVGNGKAIKIGQMVVR